MTRIFVIYVPEDYLAFDRLAAQARAAKLSVEFDRMQVKQAWVPGWKPQCRTRIYKCDAAIVLLGKHTNQGDAAWELECAQSFDMPMLGVHIDKATSGAIPNELQGSDIIEWNWALIAKFIQAPQGSSAHA